MAQRITKHRSIGFSIIAAAGKRLDAVLTKLREQEPEYRYQSTAEVIAALSALK